jgi:NAD(P)-dependent dehydrogenase (short-subunit alcohol dehydrogenase family)
MKFFRQVSACTRKSLGIGHYGGGAACGQERIINSAFYRPVMANQATPSLAYSMAKAGLHALTRNLMIELAPKKIRVNAVAPAVVETPIYAAFIRPNKIHESFQAFKALHPLEELSSLKMSPAYSPSSFLPRQVGLRVPYGT